MEAKMKECKECKYIEGAKKPYRFMFGSLHGPNMKKYRPTPTSKSAKFLKLCEVLNGAPRRFYSDSACVSNLFKAGLIKREGKKFYPTRTGRYYLSKNVVELDVTEWLLKDSKLRYTKDELTRVAITLMIGDKSYDVVDELLRKEI
jgi:hypothetical protein